MAGGFTKYNKLEVTDLGTEGTGDRIALFNSDGRLIGYVLKESLENFVPLSGTEVGKPITGNLELGADDYVELTKEAGTDGGRKIRIGFFDDSGLFQSVYKDDGVNTYEFVSYFSELAWQFSIQKDAVDLIKYFLDKDGFRADNFIDKLNDLNAFAQLGDIATGFESGYTTTDQVITATTDTIITLSGASFESDGGLNLIDGTSGKITPLLQGDILSIDIAMPLITPAGTNEYCTMTLVPFGTTNVYRAITHSFLKGAGNQDYISANWTVPIGADIITAGGLSIVINSTAGITIDSKYISVSRLHRTKN